MNARSGCIVSFHVHELSVSFLKLRFANPQLCLHLQIPFSLAYHFVRVAKHSVDSFIRNDNSSSLDSNAAACSKSNENGILALRVIHKLDNLMQENSD